MAAVIGRGSIIPRVMRLANRVFTPAGVRAMDRAAIDGLGVPVTHATRRQGSPYTLVLTKTDKLFENDKKALELARQTLAELRQCHAERAR